MPLRWASCLFRPRRESKASLEVNPSVCPNELQEQLAMRGTACLRPRGANILYERVDDAGQGAFTPPVVIYLKRLPFCGGLEVCIKRTLVTHFVSRAAREARLQVQLEHPHLLPALACVRGRHHYYLVLPAADTDLWMEAEAMRQQGTGYSEVQLRDIARQILLGLEHLHASHLAHRDIKPANVLRMADGRVAVADFGCADGCTTGFVAAGTTQFQPPECRRNAGAQLAVLPKGYDQRLQDMWGLGATLASLWFALMPEVIRGSGSSRVSGAAAAAAAVAAATAAPRGRGDNSGSGAMNEPRCSCNGGGSKRTFEAGGRSGEGGAGCRGGEGAAAAAVLAAPPLPGFLAAAGFASCQSTVGARGEVMSEALLDLLSKLLRLRPSERITTRQALQHEWLLPAGGGGVASGDACQPALCNEPTAVDSVDVAVSAGLLSPSPLVSPTKHLLPYVSYQHLELRPTESSPPITPLPPPSRRGGAPTTPTGAAAAAAASAALQRSGSNASPPVQQRRFQASPDSVVSAAAAAAAATVDLSPNTTATSPSDAASPQSSDVPRRLYHKGRSASLPDSHAHSRSCDERLGAFRIGKGLGTEARQAAKRQQQQEQQQQSSSSPPPSFSSPSSWLLRSSSQQGRGTAKCSHRTILRVFVGAGGGESSGSN